MNNAESLKRTSLYDVHVSLGAKMVPFAGYDMPVQYSGLLHEHHAVRDSVGMFDVSHMGEFEITGPDAEALLSWICSNSIKKLVDFQAQYNCMPNNEGGIVDDLIVYRYNAEKFMAVVNASNIDKDWAWFNEQKNAKNFNCELKNNSDIISLLAVQGPNAPELLQKMTDVNLSEIKFYHFATGKMGSCNNIIISNTGYTGSGGFELYVPNDQATTLWNEIMEQGKEFNIVPAGLGARDTLRLEKGYCLYGNDINDKTSPIEAGLGWITKFDEEFVNMAHHKAIKENGPEKRLIGFELLDRGIPRQHYTINDIDGNVIGEVTSGTQSPSLGKAIGMGYVKTGFHKADTDIFIEIRGKQLKAKVVKIPFLA
jgi:aminomethyltransferase